MPIGAVLPRNVNDIARIVESQTPSTDAEVVLDLRELKSIRPGALAALAAQAVAAAHAGNQVRVALPTDPECCDYLETISGFCWYLSGLDVRFEGRRYSGNFTYAVHDTILSMTTVETPIEAEKIVEEAFDSFQRAGAPSSDLMHEICDGLWEPANNAVEHSQSEIGAVCFAQIWRGRGRRLAEVAVADAGVGILETLRERFPHLSSHAEAIEMALEEGVTGLDDRQRGLGLSTLRDALSLGGPDRRLMIVSGDGCVVATPNGTGPRPLAKSWRGTLLSLLFPVSR